MGRLARMSADGQGIIPLFSKWDDVIHDPTYYTLFNYTLSREEP